jgi:hypothetical protein
MAQESKAKHIITTTKQKNKVKKPNIQIRKVDDKMTICVLKYKWKNTEDNYCTVLHSSSLARDYPSVQGDNEGRCQNFLNLEAARIPIEVTGIIFYLENKRIPAAMAVNCLHP